MLFSKLFCITSMIALLSISSTLAMPTNGLVAYYNMDGNANDASGNDNHGADSGDVRYVNGVVNQARDFDRENGFEFILFPNTLNSSAYTVSMWVNLHSIDRHNSLLMLNSGSSWSDSDFWLFTSSNRIAFLQNQTDLRKNDYASDFMDSPELNSNQTYSVVASYENNTLSVYVDGDLYTQYTNVPDVPLNSTDLNMGISPSGSGNYQIDGFVDEVSIYNRALSSGEVSQLAAIPEPRNIIFFLLGGIVCLVGRWVFCLQEGCLK